MAEVQRSTNIGEMSQRFIEFILMQAENAALMLGLRPHPATGRPEKNLEMARIFFRSCQREFPVHKQSGRKRVLT